MRKLEFASHDGNFDTIECYADENNTAVVRNDGQGNTYIYMRGVHNSLGKGRGHG